MNFWIGALLGAGIVGIAGLAAFCWYMLQLFKDL